jgi:hypothetical protein
LFLCKTIFTQENSWRKVKLENNSKFQKLDSLTIYPNSVKVYCGNIELDNNQYVINYTESNIQFFSDCSDSLNVKFRVLPMNLSKNYKLRDTSIIYNEAKGEREKFLIQTTDTYNDIFGTSGIKKNGSISRGITFGNNQDLSVNSTLNLELSGDITPNLKLLASVTDDNLPIQPEGNTNKIQEFDQVFIQVYNDNIKLIAGDFWISRPKGYFMNYKKRAQGLFVNYNWSNKENTRWEVQGSGAFSKGKFQRQIVQGIEGNQGPYRLTGAENEPFIIILSGTERVFIDGRLIERGQEFDYVINYNTAELIFTTRNPITKDIRIVVEFQYSDQNYARSLFQGGTQYQSKKLDFWINAYSEQDAKNQTIQQDLTFEQKKLLANIGDSLNLARTNSIEKVGWLENQNLYKLVDSLGIDSVLVFSINQDSAIYRANFSYVGPNKGDYIFSTSNALGKIFRWVAPVNGIPQGDYIPARLIITPKQKKMLTIGAAYRLTNRITVETEFAHTENNLNTFSRFDQNDDKGFSNRTRINGIFPVKKRDSVVIWQAKTFAEVEFLDQHFSPIEQYRSVEFDRDWNTRNKNFTGYQLSSTISNEFQHFKYGSVGTELTQYNIGDDYSGFKSRLFGKWSNNGFNANWNASYLKSEAVEKNQFLRHKVFISKDFKKIRIGYKDDFERNTYFLDTLLRTSSYLFYDHEYFLSNTDSSKINYKIFYRERLDLRSDSIKLRNAAKAKTVGIDLGLNFVKNQKLNLIINYRELKINDKSLIFQTPENTLLGRIEYDQSFFKNTINWNTFYEVGSGLELKRDFLYIKVPDGQGIYTWIDYNNDGVKDLNEFEIAVYKDQASYIRVFTPSNEYVKTFSNEFNQSLFLKPEKLWLTKTGFKKVVSYFSNQSRLRINRKTNNFKGNEAFNPFISTVRDTSLISSNAIIKNTLFFNRTGSVFGVDWTYQNNLTKTLLATGFDSRQNNFNDVSFRLNILRKYSIETSSQFGRKIVNADYTSGRNYDLVYYFVRPTFNFQPSTSFRASIITRYSEKKNVDGEQAFVGELGTEVKYNQANKGSLQGSFSYISIKYTGAENSALGFEMLESLKTGNNYTWNIGYQRSVSKNLQISVQYNGRKSENNKPIHSGGMEVRAFF